MIYWYTQTFIESRVTNYRIKRYEDSEVGGESGGEESEGSEGSEEEAEYESEEGEEEKPEAEGVYLLCIQCNFIPPSLASLTS